jgi:hypothetical protein
MRCCGACRCRTCAELCQGCWPRRALSGGNPAELLKLLLNEEVAGRERSALATHRVEATFPTGKTFATWDQGLSSIPAPTQTARTLEWIGRRENLVVCGPSGTGKNILLEGCLSRSVLMPGSKTSTQPGAAMHLSDTLVVGPLSPVLPRPISVRLVALLVGPVGGLGILTFAGLVLVLGPPPLVSATRRMQAKPPSCASIRSARKDWVDVPIVILVVLVVSHDAPGGPI